MTLEGIKNIMQFMARLDLKGAEVPAFNQCMRELEDEARAIQATPTDDGEDGEDGEDGTKH